MANNRLWLVCRECKKYGQESHKIFLGKYFPSQGWYNEKESFNERFEKFLEDHSHDCTLFGLSHEGKVPFSLDWEVSEK